MKTAFGLAVGLLIAASVGIADEQVSGVAFVLGPKHFSDGNAITIEQVVATSPNFAAGDKVTVRGRYIFKSEEKAQLCLYLTTEGSVGPEPVAPTQRAEVRSGSGTFELAEILNHPGHLHLSFYGSGGKCLGTVYFGTEQQMKEISHWDVRTH
jgi:hypothetical protein